MLVILSVMMAPRVDVAWLWWLWVEVLLEPFVFPMPVQVIVVGAAVATAVCACAVAIVDAPIDAVSEGALALVDGFAEAFVAAVAGTLLVVAVISAAEASNAIRPVCYCPIVVVKGLCLPHRL